MPGLLVTAVLRAYFHRYGKSVAPRFARVALTASPPHTCYLRRTGESAPGSDRLDRRPVVGVMPPHLFPHAPRSVRATAGPPAIRVACPSGEAGVGHLPVHAPRRQSPPVEYARAFAVRPCCSARPSSPGLCGTTFLLDVIVRPLRGQSPPLEHLVLTAPLWHAWHKPGHPAWLIVIDTNPVESSRHCASCGIGSGSAPFGSVPVP